MSPTRDRGVCSVEGCDRPVRCRELCNAHYQRQATGRPMDAPIRRWSPNGRPCSVAECGRLASYASGLCSTHGWRLKRGLPMDIPVREVTRGPVGVRLWKKVEKTATCWLWRGLTDRDGYGLIGLEGRRPARVHRVAYELLVGPIPDGLVIDHLCRVRNCVNPDHLEPVTPAENTRRGESIAPINARKTHCIRGHEFTPENTYVSADGRRRCKTCRAATQRAYTARKRAAA